MNIAITGDEVGNTSESLRGYNTYTSGERILSCVCGTVEAIDRVVSVRAPSSRYLGETGDVIVGRVKEISGTRWKVHVGSHQDAFMLLSNVTEPGGVLRRRGREDELQMRNIFAEGDVVACEVQRVLPDGTISLHTRSGEKYGRMSDGFLLTVRPQLIPRTRKHFHSLSCAPEIRLVVGVNGFIWLSSRGGPDTRIELARTHNAITLLQRAGRMLHINVVDSIVSKAKELNVFPWDMQSAENMKTLLLAKVSSVSDEDMVVE